MGSNRWCCLVIAILSAPAGSALAQPGGQPITPLTPVSPSAPTPEPDEGYAWQILAADGAAAVIATVLATTDARDDFEGPPNRAETFAGWWWMLSSAGTPAVHFAHHNPAGWASLGMRMFVPPLTSAIGALSTCMANIEDDGSGFEDDCEDNGLTGGMIIGTAGVAMFDTFLLARTRYTEPDAPQRWYGWQTLIVDAGGLAIGAWIGASEREPNEDGEIPSHTIGVGAGMYTVGFLGAPFVHVAHGRGLRALGDFALRGLGVPLIILPGVLGWCAATAGSDEGACTETGVEVGLIGGSVAAAMIDAFVLGWEDEPAPPTTGPPGISWFPSFELRPNGGSVTLNATF